MPWYLSWFFSIISYCLQHYLNFHHTRANQDYLKQRQDSKLDSIPRKLQNSKKTILINNWAKVQVDISSLDVKTELPFDFWHTRCVIPTKLSNCFAYVIAFDIVLKRKFLLNLSWQFDMVCAWNILNRIWATGKVLQSSAKVEDSHIIVVRV